MKMILDSDGDLGIGTTTLLTKLHIISVWASTSQNCPKTNDPNSIKTADINKGLKFSISR